MRLSNKISRVALRSALHLVLREKKVYDESFLDWDLKKETKNLENWNSEYKRYLSSLGLPQGNHPYVIYFHRQRKISTNKDVKEEAPSNEIKKEPKRDGLPDIHTGTLDWDIFEEGESGDVKKIIEKAARKWVKNKKQEKEWDRVKFFCDRKPEQTWMGKAGFEGYFVFIYSEVENVFLESPMQGNALYILPKDKWREYSRLKKTKLLGGATLTLSV